MEVVVTSKRNTFEFKTTDDMFKYAGTCTLNDNTDFAEISCDVRKTKENVDTSINFNNDEYIGYISYSHPETHDMMQGTLNVSAIDNELENVLSRALGLVREVKSKIAE